QYVRCWFPRQKNGHARTLEHLSPEEGIIKQLSHCHSDVLASNGRLRFNQVFPLLVVCVTLKTIIFYAVYAMARHEPLSVLLYKCILDFLSLPNHLAGPNCELELVRISVTCN